MAKINKTVNETATPEAEAVVETFADVMADKPQPTLRSIADIFGVPQQRIYSVAKQPIAGQVYDAKVYNWGAISKFIEKRIGKEGDPFQTMEEVYEAAIARDEELGSQDKRRGSRGNGSTKAVIDLGDGKSMPARRKEVAIGDIIHLKRYEEAFKVVFMTDTHVVLQVEDKPTLNCLSNWTFNQQLAADPKPAVTSADVKVEDEPTADAE